MLWLYHQTCVNTIIWLYEFTDSWKKEIVSYITEAWIVIQGMMSSRRTQEGSFVCPNTLFLENDQENNQIDEMKESCAWLGVWWKIGMCWKCNLNAANRIFDGAGHHCSQYSIKTRNFFLQPTGKLSNSVLLQTLNEWKLKLLTIIFCWWLHLWVHCNTQACTFCKIVFI